MEDLRAAALLIRHHHERFDGQGYPDRLRREQIPLGARILQAADFLDRQIAGGPERSDNLLELALRWVEESLGGALDPALYPFLKEAAPEVYQSLAQTWSTVREIPAFRLRPGMVLANDLFSGSGLLILRRGTVLDEKAISSIRRFSDPDPSERDIPIFS